MDYFEKQQKNDVQPERYFTPQIERSLSTREIGIDKEFSMRVKWYTYCVAIVSI